MSKPVKRPDLKQSKQIISNKKMYLIQDEDNNINDKLTYINMLNDDCMNQIFRFLSTDERFKVKRVNKHWSNLIDESWCMNTDLNLTPILAKIYKSDDLTKVIPVIEQILTVCGSYLNKIRMSDKYDYVAPNSRTIINFEHRYKLLILIGKFCPNVNILELNKIAITERRSLTEIISNCTRIKKLDLYFREPVCENELSLLFSKNKNLKSLKLRSTIRGNCLDNLTKELQNIHLDGCNSIDHDHLINLLDRTNLQMLSLCNQYSRILSNTSLVNKIGSCSNLKILKLVNIDNLSCENLKFIFQLHKLEELEIRPPFLPYSYDPNKFINDGFLQMLAENCIELKKLEISESDLITDKGLMFLTSLKYLISLTVFSCQKITGAPFRYFSNLMDLNCNECIHIENEGLSLLIESNPNLQYLYIVGCKSVNIDFVKSAVHFTSKRTNNVVLKLRTAGMKMYLDDEKNYSKHLKLLQDKRVGFKFDNFYK